MRDELQALLEDWRDVMLSPQYDVGRDAFTRRLGVALLRLAEHGASEVWSGAVLEEVRLWVNREIMVPAGLEPYSSPPWNEVDARDARWSIGIT